jgi:hypothetical protein
MLTACEGGAYDRHDLAGGGGHSAARTRLITADSGRQRRR